MNDRPCDHKKISNMIFCFVSIYLAHRVISASKSSSLEVSSRSFPVVHCHFCSLFGGVSFVYNVFLAIKCSDFPSLVIEFFCKFPRLFLQANLHCWRFPVGCFLWFTVISVLCFLGVSFVYNVLSNSQNWALVELFCSHIVMFQQSSFFVPN